MLAALRIKPKNVLCLIFKLKFFLLENKNVKLKSYKNKNLNAGIGDYELVEFVRSLTAGIARRSADVFTHIALIAAKTRQSLPFRISNCRCRQQ